jgi:hypothetical protein
VIVVAWILGGWCVASLVGGAAWSAFSALERRHTQTRTQSPVPPHAGGHRGAHETPSSRPSWAKLRGPIDTPESLSKESIHAPPTSTVMSQ